MPLVSTRAGASVRGYGLFSAATKTAFSSIATITMAGGETSATFSSIPQIYTDLQLRVFAKDTQSGVSFGGYVIGRFNGDSGTNYAFHSMSGNGGGTSSTGSASGIATGIQTTFDVVYSGTGQTSVFGVGIWDIFDYTNASKIKTVKMISGGDWNANTTNASLGISSGFWNNTAAITSITLNATSIAFAAGTVLALYGIKAAA